MTQDHTTRLSEAVSKVRIPAVLREAWTGVAPQLSAGQVWRAHWADQTQLVVVLTTDQRTTVLPLSLDIEYADATSVYVTPGDNPFGVPIVAWPELSRKLPNQVLDRFVGQLSPEAMTSLYAKQGGARSAEPVQHPIQVYRALIEDTIDALSASRCSDSGTGQLTTLIQERGIQVQSLADIIGVTPQRALAVWRGQAPVTDGEAQSLSPILAIPAEAILAANPTPPVELTECLNAPARHHQVLAYARRNSTSVADAYRDVSYQAWALAARQTGRRLVNWELRLDTVFAAVLNDP